MSEENPTQTDDAAADSPAAREDVQSQTIVKPKFSLRMAIGIMALFSAIMLLVRLVGEDWSERKQLIAVSVIFGWGTVTAFFVLLAISLRGRMQRKLGRPVYQFSSTWVMDFQAALVCSLFCYVFGAGGAVFLMDDDSEVLALAGPVVVLAIILQFVFLYSILFPVQGACCERGLCLRGIGMIRFEHIRESRWTDHQRATMRARWGDVRVWSNLQIKMLPEIDRRIHNVEIPPEAHRRVDEILAKELGDRHERSDESLGSPG